MLWIKTPPGAPPRDLFERALREFVGRVVITALRSDRPPQLQPSVTAARIAQEMDDVEGLIGALFDVAHAALASIIRVRASAEDETGAAA